MNELCKKIVYVEAIKCYSKGMNIALDVLAV